MANTYLIDDGHLIVVDPGSEQNVRLLTRYLQHFLQRKVTDIDLIVLTHLHPDHTDGVAALRVLCQAPVAASSVVRHFAEQHSQAGKIFPPIAHLAGHALPGMLHHFDLFPPPYMQQMKLVDIWLEDVMALPKHLYWRVIASPGHTPESLCLYHPFTYELLCGDTMITMSGGAPLLRGGADRQRLEETLITLRSLTVRYLYPGHGRAILAYKPLNNIEVEW